MIARGWAGPSLLAMVLFEKFGQHQPLNRQAERYAKEGVPISLSTLADQVGGCNAAEMAAAKTATTKVTSLPAVEACCGNRYCIVREVYVAANMQKTRFRFTVAAAPNAVPPTLIESTHWMPQPRGNHSRKCVRV